MPRLRVLAGPSTNPAALEDISYLVNTATPHRIVSADDAFEGELVVHIRGFVGPDGRGDRPGQARGDAYFEWNERKGVTWSIQVRGRFLKPVSADDVLFGNTFDRPLKLPWGSGAALKFMNFVDPTLEHALDSATPWALSPLISTMPYFAHRKLADRENASPDDNWVEVPLQDDVSSLGSKTGDIPQLKGSKQRRSWFSAAEKRKNVTFGPEDELTTDFCYGFLTFPKLTLALPGGIKFDLMKYWDGQPVRFVCCERQSGGSKLQGPGRTFWCVVFEVVDDEEGEAVGTWSSRGGHNTPDVSESETATLDGVQIDVESHK